jgi:hypothetical protein
MDAGFSVMFQRLESGAAHTLRMHLLQGRSNDRLEFVIPDSSLKRIPFVARSPQLSLGRWCQLLTIAHGTRQQ